MKEGAPEDRLVGGRLGAYASGGSAAALDAAVALDTAVATST